MKQSVSAHEKREEFPLLALTTIKETDKERIARTATTVHIIKSCFKRNYKWFIVFDGHKVHASMLDKEFLEKVEKRLVYLCKGDALEVEMEIQQVYDPEVKTFINRNFKILKVLRVLPKYQQRDLMF